MKFRKKIKKQEIMLEDGGKIFLKQLLPIEIADIDFDKLNDIAAGREYLKKAIIGWEGIKDEETDKELIVNDENKMEMINYMVTDEEVREKITIFLQGSFENLVNGSSVSSPTDGALKNASNVKIEDVKVKKENVDTQEIKN